MSATKIAPTSRAMSANAAKSRDRGAAREQQLGALGAREVAHLVEIDARGVAADAVLHRLEPAAGDRHVPAVGEVAAGREAEAHHGVARLEEREVDGEVGGRARIRLHVRVIGAEQRLRAVDAELFDLVDVLLTLVVALGRVALAVLVVQHGAGGGEHGGRRVVLRRDQADGVALQLLLGVEEGGELGVGGAYGVGGVRHEARSVLLNGVRVVHVDLACTTRRATSSCRPPGRGT
jgi:hypothetical protein